MKLIVLWLLPLALIALLGVPSNKAKSEKSLSQVYQQYAGYNGYIDIVNIVEVVNVGNEISSLTLEFFNSDGVVSETLDFALGINEQRDIILNDLRTFKRDTYGLIRITSSTPNVQGRISYYRISKEESQEFDFAFSALLQQGRLGDSFVSFNTFDPVNSGAITANWLSIINLNPHLNKTFRIQKYSQDGSPIGIENVFILKPFERRDIEGGHENPGPENIGLIKISPQDPSSQYIAELMRYGTKVRSSNFTLAFPLEVQAGFSGSLVVPLNNSVYDGAYSGFSWLEVTNVTNQRVQILATVFDKNGIQVKVFDLSIEPFSQRHIPTITLLTQNGSLGSIRLEPVSGKIIAQSVFYEQSSLGKEIRGAYPSQGREISSFANEASLSWNRYIGMENYLTVRNLADKTQSLNFSVQSIGGHKVEFTKQVDPNGILSIGLNDSQIGTSDNAYGTVVVKGSEKIFADVLRVRSVRTNQLNERQLDFFNSTLALVPVLSQEDDSNPTPSPGPTSNPHVSPTVTSTDTPTASPITTPTTTQTPTPNATSSTSPVPSASFDPSLQREMITASDFTYLGSFKLYNDYPAAFVNNGSGLTHRYRDGVFRLLSMASNGNLVEWTPPESLATSHPYPEASNRNYGFVLSNKNFWIEPGDAGGGTFLLPRGLLWDETKKKLYWTILHQYSHTNNPSIGIATLNDLGPTRGSTTSYGSSVGRYGTSLGFKRIKGLLHVPEAAAAELGGKRMAAGFGGYESLTQTASLGPALVAFNPDDLDSLSEGSSLTSEKCRILCDHPYNNIEYTNPQRARRNPNYYQSFDSWSPKDGIGYWTWSDLVEQSAIWIDDGIRHGAIWFVRQAGGSETTTIDSTFTPISLGNNRWTVRVTAKLVNARNNDYINFPGLGSATLQSGASDTEWTLLSWPGATNPTPVPARSGTVFRGSWYYDSKGWTTEGRLAAFFYDPKDLFSGNSNPLPYKEEANWAVPENPAPFGSWQNIGPAAVSGVTYDPSTKRLYLLFNNIYRPPGDNFSRALIAVYQLKD